MENSILRNSFDDNSISLCSSRSSRSHYSNKEVKFLNPIVSSVQNIEADNKGRKIGRRYGDDNMMYNEVEIEDDCIDDPFGAICLWAWITTLQ